VAEKLADLVPLDDIIIVQSRATLVSGAAVGFATLKSASAPYVANLIHHRPPEVGAQMVDPAFAPMDVDAGNRLADCVLRVIRVPAQEQRQSDDVTVKVAEDQGKDVRLIGSLNRFARSYFHVKGPSS
jgi:hypothetical protein